jgi:hypothetical protein
VKRIDNDSFDDPQAKDDRWDPALIDIEMDILDLRDRRLLAWFRRYYDIEGDPPPPLFMTIDESDPLDLLLMYSDHFSNKVQSTLKNLSERAVASLKRPSTIDILELYLAVRLTEIADVGDLTNETQETNFQYHHVLPQMSKGGWRDIGRLLMRKELRSPGSLNDLIALQETFESIFRAVNNRIKIRSELGQSTQSFRVAFDSFREIFEFAADQLELNSMPELGVAHAPLFFLALGHDILRLWPRNNDIIESSKLRLNRMKTARRDERWLQLSKEYGDQLPNYDDVAVEKTWELFLKSAADIPVMQSSNPKQFPDVDIAPAIESKFSPDPEALRKVRQQQWKSAMLVDA